MTARILEEAGIATVVVGSALDIVTFCGVPRYFYNDMPLGNPLGRPFDREMQRMSVLGALGLIDSASAPVIVESDFRFADDEAWKVNYMKIDDSNRELLKQMGVENRRKRAAEIAAGYRRA